MLRLINLVILPSILWMVSLKYGRNFSSNSEIYYFSLSSIFGFASFLFLYSKYKEDTNSLIGAFSIIFSILFLFLFMDDKNLDIISVALLFLFILIWVSIGEIKPAIKISLLIFYFIALFVVSIFLEYTIKFGDLSKDNYVAIFQSNISEAFYYVVEFLGVRPAALIGVGILLSIVLARPFRQGWGTTGRPAPGLLHVFPLASILLISSGPFVFGIKEQVKSLPVALEEFNLQRKLQLQISSSVEKIMSSTLDAEGPGFDGNVIVVIGEGVTRHNMSIYGYHRKTTPLLEEISNTERLIHFEDVVSPFSHTVPSLLPALTPAIYHFRLDKQAEFLENYENNIIILARKTGVKTTWISNQLEYGLFENPTTTLAKLADQTVFINDRVGKFSDAVKLLRPGTSRDIDMVEALKTRLSDNPSNNLIFLHMDTAHAPYCSHSDPGLVKSISEGSPLGAGFFGDAQDYTDDVNCYDAAVRKVDEFLDTVFSISEDSSAATMVIYFSDHGEAPALGTGHNFGSHSHYHNEIPLLVYSNKAGRATLHEELGKAERNRDRPVLLSDLFDSLADLLKVNPKFFDAKRSIFNSSYMTAERTLNGMNRVDYDHLGRTDKKDLYERYRIVLSDLRSSNHSVWERIWAHRVNTIGSLLEAKNLFAGVETDVVFDGQSFLVYHPPKPPTGLTLETLLEAAGEGNDLRFWLDWKNPDSDLIERAIHRLEYLDERFALKDRAILETTPQAVGEHLRQISQRGWEHSYYLPTEKILDCLNDDEGARTCSGLILEEVTETLVRLGASPNYSWRPSDLGEARVSGRVDGGFSGRIFRAVGS